MADARALRLTNEYATVMEIVTRYGGEVVVAGPPMDRMVTELAEAMLAQPATPVGALDFDAMRIAREWPTPMHMHRVANALDAITPAKYGDVLRWFADRCDEWIWHMDDPAAAQRLVLARLATGNDERGAAADATP